MASHDDFLELIESQMPIIKAVHARGSLEPMAAWMDLDGDITGEVTPAERSEGSVDDAIERYRSGFTEALDARTIRVGAVFFHGYLDANGAVLATLQADEARMIVVWLQHADKVEPVQALIRYSVQRGPGSAIAEVKYEDPAFGPPPRGFMARTFPRDGESTVIRIENELVDLLRDRLKILRELHECTSSDQIGQVGAVS